MNVGAAPGPLIVPPSAKLTDAAFARVEARASGPCPTCEAHEWWLSKWQRGQGWCVDIQCVTCGTSGGQPFPKNEHPHWQTYPEFDRTRNDRWHAERREASRVQREAANAQWQADYSEWLATSPEWARMRKLVMKRANGLCEACLERPAIEVHHQNYDLGKLPPAYYLVAVCRACHERMSTPGDEWGPPILDGAKPTGDAEDPYEVDGEIEF
jgi:hypothetical protein